MGDIPDWSLPENNFDGYVNSVGSLINTVVNTATEFAAGVNHGVAAGSNAPNPGTTYSPSSELGYGSGGQEYWDNEDINLPTNDNLVEFHVNASYIIFSFDFYAVRDKTGSWQYEDPQLKAGGGIYYPSAYAVMKDVNLKSFEEYNSITGTLSFSTTIPVSNFVGIATELTFYDSNKDTRLEILSKGIGIGVPPAGYGIDTSGGSVVWSLKEGFFWEK